MELRPGLGIPGDLAGREREGQAATTVKQYHGLPWIIPGFKNQILPLPLKPIQYFHQVVIVQVEAHTVGRSVALQIRKWNLKRSTQGGKPPALYSPPS